MLEKHLNILTEQAWSALRKKSSVTEEKSALEKSLNVKFIIKSITFLLTEGFCFFSMPVWYFIQLKLAWVTYFSFDKFTSIVPGDLRLNNQVHKPLKSCRASLK